MQTLAVLFSILIFMIIFVKVPLTMFRRRFMIVRPVMLVAVLLTFPFIVVVDSRSIVENNHRVEAWHDRQCVRSDQVAASVFIAKDGTDLVGTAFMLENGYVVTNQHVSEALDTPMFEANNGQSYRGELVYRADPNTGSDIAVYRVPDAVGDVPGLKLGSAEPAAGEQLMTVGQFGRRHRFHVSVLNVFDNGPRGTNTEAPMSLQLQAVMMPRLILSALFFGDEESGNVTETTANGDIGPGSSGSPAVNCAGEVVGVAYAIRGYYLHPEEQTNYLVSLAGLSTELVHANWAESDNTSDAEPTS